MKITELRIGNIIFKDDKEYLVTVKTIEFIEWKNEQTLAGERLDDNDIIYTSIELTPEWLGRIGFKESNGFYCKAIKDSKNHMCIEKEGRKFILTIGYDDLVIELKYIHQLQNLYFALTYEELKISELIKK